MLDGRTIGVRECTPDNGERKPRAPRQSQPAAEKNSHMTFDEEPKKEEEKPAEEKPAEEAEKTEEAAAPKEEAKSVEEDNANYIELWEQFGKSLKIGVIEDSANRNKLAKLLRYKTSLSEGKWTSLDHYVERMKDWQKQIYYVSADSVEKAESSMFLDAFKKRGVEVLYFTEPIDEYVAQNLREFSGKSLQDITKEGVEFGDEKEHAKKVQKEYENRFEVLTSWMKELLGDKVDKVEVTATLESAPGGAEHVEVRLLGDDGAHHEVAGAAEPREGEVPEGAQDHAAEPAPSHHLEPEAAGGGGPGERRGARPGEPAVRQLADELRLHDRRAERVRHASVRSDEGVAAAGLAGSGA